MRDLRNKAKSRSKLRSFKLWLEVWGCCLFVSAKCKSKFNSCCQSQNKTESFLCLGVWFCKKPKRRRRINGSRDLKRWWYWRPLRQSYDRRPNGTAQATDFCLRHHLWTARWDAQGRHYPTGPRRFPLLLNPTAL